MPFVRKKRVNDTDYFYLVESYRVDGKPRQRVVCYLGEHSTVSAAHKYWQEQAKDEQNAAARKHAREMVRKLEQYL